MVMVVDPSAVMAWCFRDEATEKSAALLSRAALQNIVVPTLWFSEVTNSLLLGEKRHRTNALLIGEFTRVLLQLQITVDNEGELNCFERILPLSRAHNLTAYDALYLELAIRRQLPLASNDTALRAAALACDVQLI